MTAGRHQPPGEGVGGDPDTDQGVAGVQTGVQPCPPLQDGGDGTREEVVEKVRVQ